jgi:hypothetical protein
MQLGGDAILKMSAAQSGGLILTQENIKASEEWRQNLNELEDAGKGLVTQFGNAVIPVLNQIAQGMKNTSQAQQDYNRRLQEVIQTYGNYGDKANNMRVLMLQEQEQNYAARDAINAHADALNNTLDPALDGTIVSLEDQKKAIEESEKANADTIKGAIDMQKGYDSLTSKLADQNEQMLKLDAEKAKLYPWEKDKIQEITDKQNELRDAQNQTLEDYKKGMQEKFAMMAIEKIAMSDGVAGYNDAEMQKAQAVLATTDAVTAGAMSQQLGMEMLTTAVANGKITVEQYGIVLRTAMADGVVSVDEIKKAIASIPSSKTFTLQVVGMDAYARLIQDTRATDNPNRHYSGFASGGSFVVPPSYGNEGFNMGGIATASGGEQITVSARGQQQQSGGIDMDALVSGIVRGFTTAMQRANS